MIHFDFDYCKAESIEEALSAYNTFKAEGKSPLYYSGGTEIVTFCRGGQIKPDVLIDIKSIPECRVFDVKKDTAVFGSALALSEIVDANVFPLLADVSRGVADRTVRNRITLGGNICGRLPYREAVLPFLLCGGKALVAGEGSMRWLPVKELFDKKLKIGPGELLVQLEVPKEALSFPFGVVRRTQGERVSYPIITLAGIMAEGNVRIALTGAFGYPFLLPDLSDYTEGLMGNIPSSFISDTWASSDYRRYLTELSIRQIFKELGVL